MDELENLIREYQKEIPEKASIIQRLIQRAIHDLGCRSKPNWEEAAFVIHKLAGSAGTYGFAELSKITRYLEDAITSEQITQLKAEYAAGHLQRWCELFSLTARASAGTDKQAIAQLQVFETRLNELQLHLTQLTSGQRVA